MIEKSLEESYNVRSKLMVNYENYKEICQQSATFFMGISKIYEINVVAFTNKFLEVMSMQKVSFFYKFLEFKIHGIYPRKLMEDLKVSTMIL